MPGTWMSMRRAAEAAWLVLPVAGLFLLPGAPATPPTTERDFFTPGTQPLEYADPYETALVCSFCHGGYSDAHEPYRLWDHSMMGQAARDPVFRAAVAIANQDAPGVGVACFRCHAPFGYVEGRVTADGSQLQDFDFEGISCIMCHRMVDPQFHPGISPPEDEAVLNSLAFPPVSAHNTAAVWDTFDRRRGPFNLDLAFPGGFPYHAFIQSPFHLKSQMCATCHEVSNPAYTEQVDGSYSMNSYDTPHPTQNKYDMFPEQRTYSEWSQSAFALAPIDMGTRYGGNPLVSTCQDCHMPTTTGTGCAPFLSPPVRSDLPRHYFAGANNWVLKAVDKLYPRGETDLDDQGIADAIGRAEAMLQAASDLALAVGPGSLNVRVINQSGHKLPTGYPEGRRIWVNVQFRDAAGTLIAERGAYDDATHTLTTGDTKVYEGVIGLDAAMAAISGLPEGEGFHLALNNTWIKDNRIPPRGFTNAGFDAVQASPVGTVYADGQYWDDTAYAVPPGSASATVRVFYQLTTHHYAEFLRDANTTTADGTKFWTEYVRAGFSPPVEMDIATVPLCTADFNNDGSVDFFDYDDFVGCFEGLPCPPGQDADFNNDGSIDFFDYDDFVLAFESGC